MTRASVNEAARRMQRAKT